MSDNFFETFSLQRAELIARASQVIAAFPDQEKILETLFWENSWCDKKGNILDQYHPHFADKKFNLATFEAMPEVAEVEKVPDYRRLAVTSHRVLELTPYPDSEAFFRALSQKNRKKLRWLKNALPAQNVKVVPFDAEKDFDDFEDLYSTQFPKNAKGSARNEGMKAIYKNFFSDGTAAGWKMLYTADGKTIPIAFALGFFCGKGFYFTHLTRSEGVLDKFSPGFFLAFQMISDLIDRETPPEMLFMGPGESDYKRHFLGKQFAIYRYEPDSWRNLPGLIRLYHRAWKQKHR